MKYNFFTPKIKYCSFEIYFCFFYKFVSIIMKITFLIQSKLPCILQMKKVVV